MAFRAKFSDAQREALVRAALDYGLSARRAAILATRGELPGADPDLPAFAMTYEYAAQLVREERNRRGAREAAASTPETIMRQTLGMLAMRLEEQVRRLERRRKPPTPSEIGELARAGKEIASLARAVHGLPAERAPKAEKNGEAPADSDLIGALAAEEGRG
jgi:hypothetical protein